MRSPARPLAILSGSFLLGSCVLGPQPGSPDGMKVDQARKYKDLELENTRLKKLVADLSLREAMLKEVIKGNF